ncbi:hypothetical protein DPMN_182094 [Dreissena polymorpha]|uniref:Uncharacterized protein n=1 Tax=Dreissena polymorpha TaxID=45954 RepID=A0A9D4DFR8_DREPO|nr:hypothetical protein DPMN_182094 [Dreissena polymorpha]
MIDIQHRRDPKLAVLVKLTLNCPYFMVKATKGDVIWQGFIFELDSLMAEGIFSEDQILYGLRRAFRGKASDHLRRAGVGLTLDVAVRKLEQDICCIEPVEYLLQRFYSIEQKAREKISTYCARLEDLYELIVKLGGCSKGNTDIFKRVLYKGLKKELKRIAGYKFDTVHDYDKFKMELRIMEAEIKSPESE